MDGLSASSGSVNPSGGDALGNGGSVAYSIGQILYTSNTGNDVTVHQGVQIAYELFTVGLTLNFLLFAFYSSTYSQTVRGTLTLFANQEIKLEGFNGLKTYPISKFSIDEKRNFKLNYY